MSESWSREEVEAAVMDYFVMLENELRGLPYNKAEHSRQLLNLLSRRTRGSIERKHQNISAVLIELGYPYIDGYKPLGNYQELLIEVLEKRLAKAEGLQQLVTETVTTEVNGPASISDLLSILVPPPDRECESSREYSRPSPRVLVGHRNYLELETRNRSLGLAGEELVLKFEYERLLRANKRILADRIEHISRTKGDGLGYDIHSFEENGRDRLIEVKTTRFGELTPFFASRNEVLLSLEKHEYYQLYRLFNFRKKPQFFTLTGSLRGTCHLEPYIYTARPT